MEISPFFRCLFSCLQQQAFSVRAFRSIAPSSSSASVCESTNCICAAIRLGKRKYFLNWKRVIIAKQMSAFCCTWTRHGQMGVACGARYCVQFSRQLKENKWNKQDLGNSFWFIRALCQCIRVTHLNSPTIFALHSSGSDCCVVANKFKH